MITSLFHTKQPIQTNYTIKHPSTLIYPRCQTPNVYISNLVVLLITLNYITHY